VIVERLLRSTMASLAIVAASIAQPALAAEAAAGPADDLKIAIVVGANESRKSGLPALQFADDDAIRAALLFRMAAAETTILVDADSRTKQHFPSETFRWLAHADSPTTTNLRLALDAAVKRSREVHGREPARKTHVYLVVSAHGGRSSEGEGAFMLDDGPFWRSDLYERLLAHTQPTAFGSADVDYVHLIIDSCYSQNAVSDRGGGATIPTDGHRMSAISQRLADYPHVGVILATNESGKTQEWDLYQGGIFSHQILSALLGAADVFSPGAPGSSPTPKPDQVVNYTEAAAFLQAVNAPMSPGNQNKLHTYVRPPGGDPVAPLVRWHGQNVPRLHLKKNSGHMWVADSSGNRWVELNRDQKFDALLVLPERPDYNLFGAETADDSEGKLIGPFKASPGPTIEDDSLSPPSYGGKQSRSPSADPELKLLFNAPYGPLQATILQDRLFETPPGWDSSLDAGPPIYKRWWFWTATAALVGGAVTTAIVLGSRNPSCPTPADCKNAR